MTLKEFKKLLLHLRIILGEKYICYENALKQTKLETLEKRRDKLCLIFAQRCIESDKSHDLFPLKENKFNTRNNEKYFIIKSKTKRLSKSTIPYLQKLLNESYKS